MNKRLYRSVKDRKIVGVAGGVAEYLGVDPSLIRVLWIFFTLFGGSGIVVYIIAAIIIPEDPEELMPRFRSPHGSAPKTWSTNGGSTNDPIPGDLGTSGDSGAGAPGPGVSGAAPGLGSEGGPGPRIYPEAPRREPEPADPGNRTRETMLGLGLVGIGAYFLLSEFFPFWFSWIPLWPLVLILLGLVLLTGGIRRGRK